MNPAPPTGTVRILYHGLIPDEVGSTYWESRKEHVRALGLPVEIAWRALDPATYAAVTPAELARLAVGEAAQALAIARNVAQSDPGTFDAVVIGVIQDTGLDLCRTLVDVPVVGYGQASTLVSRAVAGRAGLLLFNPDLAELVEARLARVVPGHLVATELLNVSYHQLVASFAGGEPAEDLARQAHAAGRALAARGAQVVIPGQMLLAESLWSLGARQLGGLKVIDGLGATLGLASLLVQLQRTTGLGTPREGFAWSAPPAAVRDLLGLSRTAPGSAPAGPATGEPLGPTAGGESTGTGPADNPLGNLGL